VENLQTSAPANGILDATPTEETHVATVDVYAMGTEEGTAPADDGAQMSANTSTIDGDVLENSPRTEGPLLDSREEQSVAERNGDTKEETIEAIAPASILIEPSSSEEDDAETLVQATDPVATAASPTVLESKVNHTAGEGTELAISNDESSIANVETMEDSQSKPKFSVGQTTESTEPIEPEFREDTSEGSESNEETMEEYAPTLLHPPHGHSESGGNEASENVKDNQSEEENFADFVGKVLNEHTSDVQAWINNSSTDGADSTDIVNQTRGGSQDSDASNESSTGDSKPLDGAKGESKDHEEAPESPMPTLNREMLEVEGDLDTDAIVSVVTWNLAEESPSEVDATFIRNFRKAAGGSDLVLISGQECENIKPRRTEGRRSREYRRLMIKMLGRKYVPIALHLLGGIQFGLFAKRSFLKKIEEVSVADVTCGIGNVFHNKGAIAAFLTLKAKNPGENKNGKQLSRKLKMVLVTAHLAAHVKHSDARDSDFWRISSELEAQAPEGFLPRNLRDHSEETGSSLFDSVDRVFFCGDLNYRVDLPRECAEFTVLHGDSPDELDTGIEMKPHDQLYRTLAGRRAFTGFSEGKVTFAPTFKFDKDTGEYDTSHKQRIPAWTDRILFKPNHTRVLEYASVPGSRHSDHRPVHATFRTGMQGRELPTKGRRRKKNRDL